MLAVSFGAPPPTGHAPSRLLSSWIGALSIAACDVTPPQPRSDLNAQHIEAWLANALTVAASGASCEHEVRTGRSGWLCRVDAAERPTAPTPDSPEADGDEIPDGATVCWYWVEIIRDIRTGRILYYNETLLWCEFEGGGGCTADQIAIAAEYKESSEYPDWPCHKFTTTDGINLSDMGVHGHESGYLDPAYTAGRDFVFAQMEERHGVEVFLNATWRCPEGHLDVLEHYGGDNTFSQHVLGLAGDFDAGGFDREMWEQFYEVGLEAGASEDGFSGYGSDDDCWCYTTRIHIDWR